jgi:hypothetical protein
MSSVFWPACVRAMKPEPEPATETGHPPVWSRVMIAGLAALWITTLLIAAYLTFGN